MEAKCRLCGIELSPDEYELCRACAKDNEAHERADRDREEG